MPPCFISRSEKIIPDAFHGTSEANGTRICNEGFTLNDGRLAAGAYFWEGSLGTAQWWARKRFKQTSISVIQAKIELGFCLDLTIAEHAEEVRKMIRAYAKRLNRSVSDKDAITMVAKLGQVDSVRAVQFPDDPQRLSAVSDFVRNTRIIISVRNLDCIRDVMLSYTGI